jgi:hypothetical protein
MNEARIAKIAKELTAKSRLHPSRVRNHRDVFALGMTKAGFDEAILEEAGSDDPSALQAAAKDFIKAAEKRRKAASKEGGKLLKDVGATDYSTRTLFNISIGRLSTLDTVSAPRSVEDPRVQKEADELYNLYTAMSNVIDRAEDVLRKGKIAKELTAKGDPWGERDAIAKEIGDIASSVGNIWISEDSYHFDDPKYAKDMDSKIAKIKKIVADASRKIESITNGM